MAQQKFSVGDLVTSNDVEKPRESIDDPFAGVGTMMASKMPARVIKTHEFDKGQSVYLDIPDFEHISYNSLYLRVAGESELK